MWGSSQHCVVLLLAAGVLAQDDPSSCEVGECMEVATTESLMQVKSKKGSQSHVVQRFVKNVSSHPPSQVSYVSLDVDNLVSGQSCPCTWDASFPCEKKGQCWSWSTAASCEREGGQFCGTGGPPPCTCTWDPNYSCMDKDGQCWSYSTQRDCEAAKGTFCGKTGSVPTPNPVVPAPSPASQTPSGTFGTETGEAGWVADHNYFRGLHGAQPVAWDADLAAKAQAVASKQVFKHSDMYNTWPPSGENLATGLGPCSAKHYNGNYDQHCATASWYEEYYLWNGVGDWKSKGGIGHFTAMVWKGIDAIGCASAGDIYVCEYGSSKCKTRGEQYGGMQCWSPNPSHLANFNQPQCSGDICVEGRK